MLKNAIGKAAVPRFPQRHFHSFNTVEQRFHDMAMGQNDGVRTLLPAALRVKKLSAPAAASYPDGRLKRHMEDTR
jgi:hypothetical protein